MPAKLDTSKPLRLIGIQIYEGTHENVRKVLTPGWYPFIKCKNDDEMGTNTTVYPIITDDGCPQDYYWIDQKRLPRISISAIAGKNGSGKSSLVEILYRILNNFAKELLQMEDGVDTGEVEQVYGLEARLYFEQDGVQKFINLDDGHVTYFEVMDGKLEQINIHLLSERQRYEVLLKLYDKGYRYIRNIDDFECYVDSNEAAQRFLSDLEEALREYDLPLNHKKTAIMPLPVAIAEKWIHKLNGFLSINKEQITYKEVNAYLDLALGLANSTGNSAVLKYAIKALSGRNLTTSAKNLAAQRIMHMSVVYPYLVQMMEDSVFGPMGVKKDLIKDYADALYADSKSTHNYEAISYAIYYSLKHDFNLKELDVNWVIERGDCVLLLMTWLYYMKINSGNRSATDLKPLRREAMRLKDSDMDRYWLFCYEVVAKDNLPGDWKAMKKAKVSFVKAAL